MKKTLNARFSGCQKALGFSRLRFAIFSGLAASISFLSFTGTAFGTVLPGHVPAGVAKAALAGRLPGTNHLSLAIGLPLRHREGLTNFLQQLHDPTSAGYRQFLTPEQFTEKFGPTQADYDKLVAFAQAHGLKVAKRHPNRMVLDVEGPVTNIEEALQVKMQLYHHPFENRDFFAPDTNPTVPNDMAVTDISGLNNYSLPHPKYHIESTNASTSVAGKAGSGNGGTYLGGDFRAAYAPGVALTGTGQTVALLQFDGYNASDIAQYEALAGLPNVTLTNVLLDGFNGLPTGNGGEVEVSLDIEMVISMAPGVSGIILYEAGPFGFQNDILSQMANDNLARQISCSWGWLGGPATTTEQLFLQMDAQGQTFLNASGDGDAFLPGQVDDPTFFGAPSSSPNITQVGGTTLATTGPLGAYASEQVWQVGNDNGSSGGISSFYPLPSWQQGIDMTTNMGSTKFRNIPDVALTGDNVLVIADNGSVFHVGGTSCAAPLWGGFMALVNEQAQNSGEPSIGFLNPAIYAIASSTNYNLCFHDVTVGNNTNSGSPTLFFAVPGYDLCTGLGTPSGQNLINALAPPVAIPVLLVTTNIVTGGNGNGVIDFNECNSLLIGVTNTGSSNATTVIGQLSCSTPGVVIPQSTVTYPDIPVGGSVTNLTPFQVSTAPTFVCGTPVTFTLTLKCDQTVATRVFTINSGTVGLPVRFDSTNAVAFPGSGSISSPVTVSNITAAVKHISVSLFLQDQFDFGVNLQLIGPDGTTVLLTQNNGGNGQNYGADCNFDTDRTTFDDSASASINSGLAPFIGSFQPDGQLSTFIGKTGTNVNGTWQLRGSDEFQFGSGVIECWSLILTPSSCTDGGGQCPGVDLALGMTGLPNPIFVQSNLTYTISVTNNGPDTATGVAVSQTLPANAVFVSAVSSQGFCTQSGNVLTGNLGTLVVNSTATMTVIVTPTTTNALFSTASVGSQQPELNPANNSASVVTSVHNTTADISDVLTANPSPVLLNGLLTYTATVANNGPAVATNVLVTNTLPANVNLVSSTSSQGTVSGSANLVIANLGTLNPGSNATVVMQVQPLVLGTITATSAASSDIPDPSSGNNVSSVTVAVTPAADLALTLIGPPSVVVGSNIIYQVTVLNQGPSLATGINIKDSLPANVAFVSATNSSPNAAPPTFSGGIVTCVVTNLAANASTTMIVVGSTTALSNAAPISVLDTATLISAQADPNTNNNSASLSTLVTFPTINVVNAGFLLTDESFLPKDGMIESNETVTMVLRLQNLGNITTANITATLLATNGVIPVGNPTQNYGTLGMGSAAVGEPFTFTASGTNGGTITANLLIQNGVTNLLVPVKFTFNVAAVKAFANTTNIVIPDHGTATPYPSSNVVSGVAGLVGHITVTLTNVNHTFPDDIDMLLVGPGGQSVVLMAHAGGGGVLTNTSLTFDDAATNTDGTPAFLPASSQIISGSYVPSAYGTFSFPTNAPVPPYSSNLTVFNGVSPNGVWRLFVFDSSPGDQGIIVGGWSINITSGSEVNPVVDLAVTGKSTPTSIVDGANLTYNFTITNNGPNVANVVTFSNALPANVTLVSATNSAHAATTSIGNSSVACVLTNLSPGSNVTVTVVVIPNAPGQLSSVATVTGSDGDPNQSNNSATVVTTATAPVADMGLTLTGPANGLVGSNLTYVVTVTNNGPSIAVGVIVTNPLNGSALDPSSSSSVLGTSPVSTNGAAICSLGSLNAHATATVVFVLDATLAGTITNTASVSTLSTDSNSTNNSASIITVIQPQTPNIVAAGAHLISPLPFGSIAPGSTVSVSLQLANVGTADTTDLVATMLATNGVTPVGNQFQTYGVLAHGGPAKAGSYTFTASGINNGGIAVTLQLVDGTNALGTVAFNFNLPGTNSFPNSSAISIPDHGVATPYPAAIVVSGLNGVVSKATVTVSGLSHQFPNDIELMVVAPSGQSTVLMSGVGGSQSVSNITLTFDDAASGKLPTSSTLSVGTGGLVSGTYQPTEAALAMVFPQPAPGAPYGTTLSNLNGATANGTWSLYVLDNSPGDSGSIAQGWSLNLSTVSPVDAAADLGVSLSTVAGPVPQGTSLIYSVSVTNKGPADASNVLLTNTLPSGVSLIGSSIGFTPAANNAWVLNLGQLAVGSSSNFTTTITSSVSGTLLNQISVGSDQTDLDQADNIAQSSFTITGGPKLSIHTVGGALSLTLNGPNGVYDIFATTNITQSFSSWSLVGVVTNTAGSFQYIDTNASGFSRRYYRAVLTP